MDLSSRCSNLSRALSPKHGSESAGPRLGGPILAPSRIGYSFYIIYIENFVYPTTYSIATSLSLLRYRNDGRS